MTTRQMLYHDYEWFVATWYYAEVLCLQIAGHYVNIALRVSEWRRRPCKIITKLDMSADHLYSLLVKETQF